MGGSSPGEMTNGDGKGTKINFVPPVETPLRADCCTCTGTCGQVLGGWYRHKTLTRVLGH